MNRGLEDVELMTYNHMLFYEQGYSIHLNTEKDPLFYYFDYDERSYNINMEFQHFHQFYEIHILLDQQASHIIEGNYYDIQPYDMVLLRPSLLHKTQYPEGAPKKRLIINFAIPQNTLGLEDAFHSVFSVFDEQLPIFRFSEEIRQYIFNSINEIFTLSKQPSSINPLIIHSKFLAFLGSIYQHRADNIYSQPEASNSIIHKMYSITSYIHSHYADELSLDFLSTQFFISPYYLSHQFKKITGFTLTTYIQMTRIRNAQQLLIYSHMKITEIAERCGFTSFSQFNRVFNKFNGLSPSQFRMQQLDQQKAPDS